MKNWICLVLSLTMLLAMTTMASAESGLSDFSSRLLNMAGAAASVEEAEDADADVSFGAPVYINDTFFEKVRSSAYLKEDKYSTEANVMIEIKNVSGKTLYLSDASITAYNEAGEVLAEKSYANVGPDMVLDGESFYVWEWFYDSIASIADVSHFEVKVEAKTDSYHSYEKIDANALVSNGIAYALVENTTDNDIYGISVVVCVENADGVMQDVVDVGTGNAIGIFPGSTMILRDSVEDHATGTRLNEGITTVSALRQLD